MATGAYSYDTGNRLTGLAYTSNAGATSIDTFGWGFDNANRVTSFTSNDGTAGYSYDVTNQVTAASYTTSTGGHQPANESYSFDANGNRDSTGYSTAADNLITSDGTFNYTHDADGNTISRTRISSATASDYLTTYTWDYRNRLTDVEYYDNSSVLTKHVHYVYDVFDHLLATQVDTTGSGSYNQVEYYVLDVSPEIPSAGVPGTALAQPLLQFDGSGNLTTRYLEAVDQIFAQGAVSSLTSADTENWDLVDNLGSVRDVLGSSGNLLDKIDYNSFGQVAYESNAAIQHFAGYTGGHIDIDTGFVEDYHRWYDPATGKWLSADPDGFAAGDANLLRIVGNDVASRTDPAGLQGEGSGQGGNVPSPQIQQMIQDLMRANSTQMLIGYCRRQQNQLDHKIAGLQRQAQIWSRHKAAADAAVTRLSDRIALLSVVGAIGGSGGQQGGHIAALGSISISYNRFDIRRWRLESDLGDARDFAGTAEEQVDSLQTQIADAQKEWDDLRETIEMFGG